MLSNRTAENVQKFCLWGSMINLVMLNYLPVLTALFIGVVGMEWNDGATTSHIFKNMWLLFMVSVWIVLPVILMVQLYRNRDKIGKKDDMLEKYKQRDYHKIRYHNEWLRYQELQMTHAIGADGKKKYPYGCMQRLWKKVEVKIDEKFDDGIQEIKE